jgi:hypothetical protein
MKKVLFSAIVVIAFSGVSMANNREESKSSENLIVADCESIASTAASSAENRQHSAYGICYTSAQYNQVRRVCLAMCKAYLTRMDRPVLEPIDIEIDDTFSERMQ